MFLPSAAFVQIAPHGAPRHTASIVSRRAPWRTGSSCRCCLLVNRSFLTARGRIRQTEYEPPALPTGSRAVRLPREAPGCKAMSMQLVTMTGLERGRVLPLRDGDIVQLGCSQTLDILTRF